MKNTFDLNEAAKNAKKQIIAANPATEAELKNLLENHFSSWHLSLNDSEKLKVTAEIKRQQNFGVIEFILPNCKPYERNNGLIV